MSNVRILDGARAAMRHRDYRNYTLGSVISLIGTWVQRVALGWLTWDITHSYGWLGVIAFADMFAMMLFSPIAGHMSDRMDRLRLQTWAQILMLGQASVMVAVYYAGFADKWVVLALTLALGLMHALHASSRLALVPNLVPREDLTPAIAINSLIFNLARFLGPAVAGLIIVHLGIGPAFIFNALSFVIFLWALRGIRDVRIENAPRSGESMWAGIAEGVRYSMRHAGIGPMLLILAVTAFTGRAIPDLLAGYADGVFHRGAEGLAWLTSAMGLGATLSGFYLLKRNGIHGMTAVVFTSVALMSASCIAFATLGSFWAAVPLLVVAGFAMNNASIATLNLMQNAVHGHLRGRVMSFYSTIQTGAPAIGTLMIGAIAESVGLPWPVAVTSACGLVLWVMMRGRVDEYRRALEIDPPTTDAGAAR